MITSLNHQKFLDLIEQVAPTWRLADIHPLQPDTLYVSYWINLHEDRPGVVMHVTKSDVELDVRENWHSVFFLDDYPVEERWPALKSFLKTRYRFTRNIR